jgi:alpha,alpha-trehalase
MHRSYRTKILFTIIIVLLSQCSGNKTADNKNVTILPPEQLYRQLFYDVQSGEGIFSDSKTFVDCVPLKDIQTILNDYSKIRSKSDSVISDFIKDNFLIPASGPDYKSDSLSVNEHITKLWDILNRPSDSLKSGTLIPLSYPYIVPGGRFREMYYWDSYFTMLGLLTDKKFEMIQHLVDNFSSLINTYGFIPNGNRTYYLSRSQPPFYALMISVLAETKGDSVYIKYLKYLEKEYAFWMDGADKLNDSLENYRRVVRLKDGEILNRYWDDRNTARAESYLEDIKTADEAVIKSPGIIREDVFRNLRAAAESGWDFSSRWLNTDTANKYRLFTIRTTDIIPVDLNSLLYNLEYSISRSYQISDNKLKAEEYRSKYEMRKKAIIKYCWNPKYGFFMDFNFKYSAQTSCLSLAGLYPLYFNISNKEQAYLVAEKVKNSFLKSGGVVTTLNKTGQQWDAPNGWAPLQWITINGLRNYGYGTLADDIRKRWLDLNNKVYYQNYKLLEKYNVEDTTLMGGGGEYPNQDGFGWTNGVYQILSAERKRE